MTQTDAETEKKNCSKVTKTTIESQTQMFERHKTQSVVCTSRLCVSLIIPDSCICHWERLRPKTSSVGRMVTQQRR